MTSPPPAASVSGAARRLSASVLALGRIRLELLAIEVQEEKERATALLFWSVLGALMVGFGLVFIALVATVVFWETHRVVALAIGAVVFVTLAVVSLRRVAQLAGEGTTLFQASLGELRADEAALRSRGDAP